MTTISPVMTRSDMHRKMTCPLLFVISGAASIKAGASVVCIHVG